MIYKRIFPGDSKYSVLKNLRLHPIVDCTCKGKPHGHSKHSKEIWQEFLHLLFYYVNKSSWYFCRL